MKAIVCRELTGIEGLTLEDIPAPALAPGQVRIRVRACGVNFADSLITRGQYQVQPQPPFSPGFEVAGEVLEVGKDVTGFTSGDRVIAITPHGGYAEQVVLPAESVVRMPSGLTYEQAATIPMNGLTARMALDLLQLPLEAERPLASRKVRTSGSGPSMPGATIRRAR